MLSSGRVFTLCTTTFPVRKSLRTTCLATNFRWNSSSLSCVEQDAQAAKEAAERRLTGSGIIQSKDEKFKVSEVTYQSGRLSTINLPPTEILKRTSLLPRDLVSLHLTSREEERSQISHRHPQKQQQRRRARPPTAILPRQDCILLSFGTLRAVARHDSVFVLDAHVTTSKSFAKDLAALFQTDTSEDPHELVFLEAVLRDTVDSYNRRIRIFEPIVEDFLDKMDKEVLNEAGIHRLEPLKESLQSFELQVKKSLECLTSLLNDDDQMLNLLLTEQAQARQTGVPVDFARHEDVELMLSVYSRQILNVQQEIEYLLARLQSKQEFLALAMDGYRNRLVHMNVRLGIVGVSTGILTAVTGLFGMNLINGYEDSPVAFALVSSTSTTVAALVAGVCVSWIRGSLLQKQAQQRLDELETFTNALSDMDALDYTVKKMLMGAESMDRDTFKDKLMAARTTKEVTDAEVDWLFGILDASKDNQLTIEDFTMSHDATK